MRSLALLTLLFFSGQLLGIGPQYHSTGNSSFSKYERINKIESFLTQLTSTEGPLNERLTSQRRKLSEARKNLALTEKKIDLLTDEYKKIQKEFKALGTNNRIMEEIKDIKENVIVLEKQVSRLYEQNFFYKDSIKTLFNEVRKLRTLNSQPEK